MEESISLTELFEVIRKRLALIIGLGIAGIALAAVVTFFLITPKYSATTQLLVNRANEEGQSTNQLADLQTDVQMINTYKDIIKGPVILDEVRKELKTNLTTDQLKSQIEVITQQNSQVFTVQVTDADPYVAADIANAVATVFQNKIGDIMSVKNVTPISKAVPNSSQISPNSTINMLIGLIVGILVGIGFAFVLEFLDKTVRDEKFINDTLGWTNLGAVSEMDEEELTAILPAGVNTRRAARSRV